MQGRELLIAYVDFSLWKKFDLFYLLIFLHTVSAYEEVCPNMV